MSSRREPITPTAMIVIGALALTAGVLATIAYTRGHSLSRTPVAPAIMICAGGLILLIGIITSLT